MIKGKIAFGFPIHRTGLDAHPQFGDLAAAKMAAETCRPFISAPNKFTVLSAHDAMVAASASLRTLAGALMKITNDVRWLARGGQKHKNAIYEQKKNIPHRRLCMKTLKVLLIALAGILSAGVSYPAFAQEIQIVTEDYPPYNYLNPVTGNAEGFSTEIVNALLRELDIQAKIKFYPWARAYQMAENEPNVLIYSIKRTTKRENLFKWVGELLKTEIYFIALKGSDIVPTSDIETLKSYTVGTIRGGSTAKALEADGFKTESVAGREQNWKKLKAGRINLWCTELLSARHTVETQGDDPGQISPVALYEKLSGHSLYLAFSRQTDDMLVEKFRKGFARLQSQDIYHDILKKYGVMQ